MTDVGRVKVVLLAGCLKHDRMYHLSLVEKHFYLRDGPTLRQTITLGSQILPHFELCP